MLTEDQIVEYLEQTIAEGRLSGDKVGLRRTQTTAGVLMAAAQTVGDTASAQRFRLLAAQAANKQDELEAD